ncbi:MAG: fatty acid desaturase [Proteobacteria bacterium]|nr:fatty acid desaturase [Pseudomonadota bacterium]
MAASHFSLARSLVEPTARTGWFWRIEGPTFLLAAAMYAAWFVLVIFHEAIPWPLLMLLGGYVLALHFSLQHEAIHGWRSIPGWLRTAIVWPPISGWFPFELYRRAHTRHHRNTVLTFPSEDPESAYHRQEDWARYSRPSKAVLIFSQTFLGRLLISPFLRTWNLLQIETAKLRRGDFSDVPVWLGFFAGLGVVLWFVSAVCGMAIWEYYLFMVYPGFSLSMLRALIEHRYGTKAGERVAIVESNKVWGLLYLFNNMHLVHHLFPAMPWYQIPAFFRANRAALLAHSGDYHFRGYGQIARRYLLRPVFIPVHPIR